MMTSTYGDNVSWFKYGFAIVCIMNALLYVYDFFTTTNRRESDQFISYSFCAMIFTTILLGLFSSSWYSNNLITCAPFTCLLLENLYTTIVKKRCDLMKMILNLIFAATVAFLIYKEHGSIKNYAAP